MTEELTDLLTSDTVFVSTCTAAAIRMFGLESMNWDPLILRDAIEERLKLRKIPQKLFDKVNCGYSITGTNGYPTHLEIFVPCNALMSNEPIESGSLGLDDPYSLAWGVYEYMRLTGEGVEDIKFSDDVAIYGGQVLYSFGITDPVEWLKWVQYDPVKLQNLQDNVDDPSFYMNRQIGLNMELKKVCAERNESLTAQLKDLDKILPAQ